MTSFTLLCASYSTIRTSTKSRHSTITRSRHTRTLQLETLESRTVLSATVAGGAKIVIEAECDLPFGKYTAAQLKRLCPIDSVAVPAPKAAPAAKAAASLPPPTIVLDFKQASQGVTSDIFGHRTAAFDVTRYGFPVTSFNTVAQAVLEVVKQDYYNHGPRTNADDGLTVNTELNIDFVIGDIGQRPSNGATEYYYMQIGDNASAGGPLGVAGLSVVRTATGLDGSANVGDVVGTVFTNNINGLTGLTPANALISGNLGFTSNAIGGTTAHEIGHTVSLEHISATFVWTQNNKPPVMGTGAVNLPNQARILDREFEILGLNPEAGNRLQLHLYQLSQALGIRPHPTGTTTSAITTLTARSTAQVAPAPKMPAASFKNVSRDSLPAGFDKNALPKLVAAATKTKPISAGLMEATKALWAKWWS